MQARIFLEKVHETALAPDEILCYSLIEQEVRIVCYLIYSVISAELFRMAGTAYRVAPVYSRNLRKTGGDAFEPGGMKIRIDFSSELY